MASESVTKVVEFERAPAYPCGLLQVNSGIETRFALSTAECVMNFIQSRMGGAVEVGMDSEEAYVHCLLLDMVRALYRSTGAEA
jgi:hypothetical protein